MSRFFKTTLAAAPGDRAGRGRPGRGIPRRRPATPAEIHAWDIDVRPDFRGLRPAAAASPRRGGLGNQVRLVPRQLRRIQRGAHPADRRHHQDDIQDRPGRLAGQGRRPQRTAIMKVATVSTLFDYINRAMPLTAPSRSANDEVYMGWWPTCSTRPRCARRLHPHRQEHRRGAGPHAQPQRHDEPTTACGQRPAAKGRDRQRRQARRQEHRLHEQLQGPR